MATAFKGTLYSQSAPEELAGQVLRIPGKHDAFATDFLGHAGEGEHPHSVRLEALRNPETNAWQIDRVTLVSSGENTLVQRESEVKGGLCFFDALHYCSRFQVAEEAFGKQAITVNEDSFGRVEHYKVAADAAGQSIDTAGDVHPCAYGRPLTPGLFREEAYAIAQQTRDVKLPVAAAVQSTDILAEINKDLMTRSVPTGSLDALTVQTRDKHKMLQKLNDVIRSGDRFVKHFDDLVRREFFPDSSGRAYYHGSCSEDVDIKQRFLAGIFSLGVIPAYRSLSKTTPSAPVRSLKGVLTDFNRQVARLPDGEVKTLCMEFSKAAVYSINMEHAANLYTSFTKTKSRFTLGRGTRLVAVAAASINFGETDIERLKVLYVTGELKPGSFRSTLKRSWDDNYDYARYTGASRQKPLKQILSAQIQHMEAG